MKQYLITALFAATTMASTAFAADHAMKIGVLDVNQLLRQSPQVQVITQKLKSQFKSRQDSFKHAGDKLQSEMKSFQKNSAVMSASQREKAQEQIAKDRRDIARMQQDLRDDMSLAQNQAMQTFLAKVNKAVTAFANKGHYDLILQREGVPFVSKEADVTAAVSEALK
ncbi:MAG: membrane protein [marine bacterium B5-7]|nr:MAG: membrane protein [marine bacterium B5-7]